MKIYVASSWRNPHQPTVVNVLRSAGHAVYDFRNPDPSDPTNRGFAWHAVDPDWTPGMLVGAQRWRRIVDQPKAADSFRLDAQAMAWADACVFVLPCGRPASWELGWCMGRGKPGIVVALDPVEPELMFREATIVGSLADMLDAASKIHQALRAPITVNGHGVCGRGLPETAVPICMLSPHHKLPHEIGGVFMFDDEGKPWDPSKGLPLDDGECGSPTHDDPEAA